MVLWQGLNALTHIPQVGIDTIAIACTEDMRNAQAAKCSRGGAAQPVGDTPAQNASCITRELARWELVAARTQIKTD